MDDEGEE